VKHSEEEELMDLHDLLIRDSVKWCVKRVR